MMKIVPIAIILFSLMIANELPCAEPAYLPLKILIKKKIYVSSSLFIIASTPFIIEVEENISLEEFKRALLSIIHKEFKGCSGRMYCYGLADIPEILTKQFCEEYGARGVKREILISNVGETSKPRSIKPLCVFLE